MNKLLFWLIFLLAVPEVLAEGLLLELTADQYQRIVSSFGRRNEIRSETLNAIIPGLVRIEKWVMEELPPEGSEAWKLVTSINSQRWAVVEFDHSLVHDKPILKESKTFYEPVKSITTPPPAAVPNDPYFPSQSDLLKMTGVDQLWLLGQDGIKNSAAGDQIARVVIDTGIDSLHPDLSLNCSESISFVGLNPCEDEWGHGTHVAGIWTATGNNARGTSGIVWDKKPVSFQVFRKECCTEEGQPFYWSRNDLMVSGFLELAKLQEKLIIVNASIAVMAHSDFLRRVFEMLEHKALIIGAAGNSQLDLRGETAVNLPASANDLNNVISVGALDSQGFIASYSNFGRIDVWAPGNNVLSTFPFTEEGKVGEGYTRLSGTSMAAPMVSGLVDLVAQQAIALGMDIDLLTPKALKKALKFGVKFNPLPFKWGPPNQAWAPGMLKELLEPTEKGFLKEKMAVTAVTNPDGTKSEFFGQQWITIWGKGFANEESVDQDLATELSGTMVFYGNTPLRLNYVGNNQINVLLPEAPPETTPEQPEGKKPGLVVYQPKSTTLVVVRIKRDGQPDPYSAVIAADFTIKPRP